MEFNWMYLFSFFFSFHFVQWNRLSTVAKANICEKKRKNILFSFVHSNTNKTMQHEKFNDLVRLQTSAEWINEPTILKMKKKNDKNHIVYSFSMQNESTNENNKKKIVHEWCWVISSNRINFCHFQRKSVFFVRFFSQLMLASDHCDTMTNYSHQQSIKKIMPIRRYFTLHFCAATVWH